jgi:AraC-like DNA-binding protein
MMTYSTFVPNSLLKPFVECYWIVEGLDHTEQKIIPDGFSEMIFHFQDPYEICTPKKMERQSLTLIAGQLDSPIILRATGRSGVFGIKFKPTGMWGIFGFQMSELTNETISCKELIREEFDSITERLHFARSNSERINIVEKLLFGRSQDQRHSTVADQIINKINASKGRIRIQNLAKELKMSTRTVERIFQQQVGISAKLFSRLIRFNHVLSLLQTPAVSKSDLTFLAGYFDQAHFNKEFKEFSGENPELWIKNNHAFAKFFLSEGPAPSSGFGVFAERLA